MQNLGEWYCPPRDFLVILRTYAVRGWGTSTGAVVAYHEFDPYGNSVDNEGGDLYGFTGEWGEDKYLSKSFPGFCKMT